MGKNEQGITTDRYMLIPRVLIFIFNGSRVLLLKGAPTKRLWANQYNGVGGHVERGENIHQAACRELQEETGLSACDLRLAGTLLVDTSDQIGIGIYVFRGVYAGGEVQPSSEGTLEWIDLAQLDQLPAVQDLKKILQKIVAMQPGDPPFSARSFYDNEEKLQVEIS